MSKDKFFPGEWFTSDVCVSSDLIHAEEMTRDRNYSQHELKELILFDRAWQFIGGATTLGIIYLLCRTGIENDIGVYAAGVFAVIGTIITISRINPIRQKQEIVGWMQQENLDQVAYYSNLPAGMMR